MTAGPALVPTPWIDAAVRSAAWDRAAAAASGMGSLLAGDDPWKSLPRLVRLLGEGGLLALVAEKRDGGAFPEVRSLALCLARERLGWEAPLADLAFAMQGLGSFPVTLRGGDALRRGLVPRVVAGEVVCAFALTEPEAGTDLGAISTTARKDGGGYVLDGEKAFISNAGLAGHYTVFAVTDPSAPPKRRLTAFAVPGDAGGLSTERMDVLGGHPIGAVRLDGVTVPAGSRIGDEGEGLSIALATLARFRPTVGAAAVGFAQRALDESVAHVKARRQFGAPLAELPVVQARLADMACEVEAARLLVHRAAAAVDGGAGRDEIARTGSMAKLVATEAAQRVVDSAVQLHGGRGVLTSSVVARLYEDVRSLRIYEGTNDVQKALIARELLRAT